MDVRDGTPTATLCKGSYLLRLDMIQIAANHAVVGISPPSGNWRTTACLG